LVPLIVQIVAVVAAGFLGQRLIARSGVRMPLPRAVAVAVVLTLAVGATSTGRETWKSLDEQRERWRTNTPYPAKSECAISLGVDPYYAGWLIGRMPSNARYWMPPGPGRGYAPDVCLRMLLLPRLQETRLEDAQFAVLWGGIPRNTIPDLERRGGRVERYTRDRYLVRMP
jgi:hypothetical protein